MRIDVWNPARTSEKFFSFREPTNHGQRPLVPSMSTATRLDASRWPDMSLVHRFRAISLFGTLQVAALLLVLMATACSPRIGDGCGNSTNCSINGDRLCDNTQPGGACIVYDCEPDKCPDDAVCVRFRPTPARLAFSACMKRCGDCRDGYRCVNASEVEEGTLTEVIDRNRPDGTFCLPVSR